MGRRPAKAVQQAKQFAQAQLVKANPTAVASVTSTADALETALANDSSATKLGFSKAARKVAEKLPTLSESELMDKDRAQAAKHWHGIAAGTHGWEQKAESSAVMVNVALLMG